MNTAVQKARNAIAFIRRFGVLGFLHELRHCVTDRYHERRLGVETAGMIKAIDLGFVNSELMDYAAIGYREIYSAFKRIPVDKPTSTFLDYGCGKGRAVVAAAALPFKRVIGIEISDQLLKIAKKNLETMRHKRCKNIELIQVDAIQYAIPEDVNLIYFFSPFSGQTLQTVVANIYASYDQSPRQIYIVFFNNVHFENAIKNQNWIMRIGRMSFYPNRYPCGIYVTKAP